MGAHPLLSLLLPQIQTNHDVQQKGHDELDESFADFENDASVGHSRTSSQSGSAYSSKAVE